MMSGKIISGVPDCCLNWKNTLRLMHETHKTFCLAVTLKPTRLNDKDVCQANSGRVLSASISHQVKSRTLGQRSTRMSHYTCPTPVSHNSYTVQSLFGAETH